MARNRHILDGYKVLDFSQAVSGPTVTRILAEMGAEVIKVEIAPVGDPDAAELQAWRRAQFAVRAT